MVAFYIILALVIIVILLFNGLVRSKNRVDEAWSDIEVQLKRRYDLIPNLVNTVKGYAKHEEGTLSKVTEARAKATSITMDPTKLDAEQMAKFKAAQVELSQAIGRLLV